MSAFEKLAGLLIEEVSVSKLQSLFADIPTASIGPQGGAVCGAGCRPGAGMLCGLSCRPAAAAQDVVDSDGRLGLTEKDIADIRMDLPKLRQAVVYQVESQLSALRQA